MEKQYANPLEEGMKKTEKSQTTLESINEKASSTKAEKILDTIATIILWLGTIECVGAFIAGLSMFLTYQDSYRHATESIVGLILAILSIILFPIILVTWAKLKVMVNISRNLFVIKMMMLDEKEKNRKNNE